jgi:hypothetical protein
MGSGVSRLMYQEAEEPCYFYVAAMGAAADAENTTEQKGPIGAKASVGPLIYLMG